MNSSSQESQYRYFIFDCDGVLFHGRHPIPGGMEAVFELISNPANKVFLLSNNATLSRQAFFEKVQGLFEQVLSPSDFRSLNGIFKAEHCYNAGFVLAHEMAWGAEPVSPASKIICHAPQGVFEELQRHGYKQIDTLEGRHGTQTSGLTFDEFEDLELDPEVSAVVLGVNKSFDFRKLAILSSHLAQKDPKTGQHKVKFYVTNEDRVYSAGCGRGLDGKTRFIADIGAVLKQVQVASGHNSPIIVGKPETVAFASIVRDHFPGGRLSPADQQKFLMVGDNLESDVSFAINNGIHSCLVFTGVQR